MPARIDLHVHSGRYSQCAETVDPYRLGEAARIARLDGILLAEHDMLWQDEELELLRHAMPEIKIYRGIEVSAAGCHLVIVGLEDAGPFFRRIDPFEAVQLAHRHNAAVILAHPYRDGVPSLLPLEVMDAIEVDSTSVTADEATKASILARTHRKPSVASSDAHALLHVGWAWTEFPALPATDTELAAAIKAGAGRPVSLKRGK